MTKKKTLAVLAALILIISFILAACQPKTAEEIQNTMQAAVDKTMTAFPSSTAFPSATETVVPTVTPTPLPVQYGPTDFPTNVDPLTGLTVSDPSILDRRPVMIKVSNFPREGRPHAGLSSADIVFDYSTGEGGNRFLALFYGKNADQVGPIRSGRYIDRWLVSMYQGVLGMTYAWEPEYIAIVDQLGYSRVINGTENTCPAICNEELGISEISWFANTEEMTKYYEQSASASSERPNLDGMAFNTFPPDGGVTGEEVSMHFGFANEAQWKYDAASRKYLRWIDNKTSDTTFTMIPLVDRNNNQQLAFSNVIFIFADYHTLNGDDSMHEVDIVGHSGRMILFRDGQKYEGTWKGSAYNMPIKFYDSNKQIIVLQPGNTWIHITGTYSSVTETTPGVWDVEFGK